MRRVYRCCAGLDVHQNSVAACIRVSKNRKVETIKAVFGTFTEDLKDLANWLKSHKVRHIAMESTGVYWIPVWNALERGRRFELALVNPQRARDSGQENRSDGLRASSRTPSVRIGTCEFYTATADS